MADSSADDERSASKKTRASTSTSQRPKTMSKFDSYFRKMLTLYLNLVVRQQRLGLKILGDAYPGVLASFPAISETSEEDNPSASASQTQLSRPQSTATFDPRTKRVSWTSGLPTPSLTSDTSADDLPSTASSRPPLRRPSSISRVDSYRKRLSSSDSSQPSTPLSGSFGGDSNALMMSRPPHMRRPSALDNVRRRLSWGSAPQTKDQLEDYNLAIARSMSRSSRASEQQRPSTTEKLQQFGRRLSWTNDTTRKEEGHDISSVEDLSLVKIVSTETFQLRRTNSDTTALWATLNSTPALESITLSRPEVPQDSPLLALPTELLQLLPVYLSRSALVSLRQTSSRLHTLFSRLPASSSSSLSGPARFAFLTFLERDNTTRLFPIPPPRTLCGHCQRFHPRSAFPSTMHSQPAASRDCRQVWLCPHKSLSYTRASKVLRPRFEEKNEESFRAQTLFPCSRCRDSIRHRAAADPSACLLTTKIALLQRPLPGSGNFNGELFPVRDVSAALRALNFKMCPHISIGDPFLLSRYCRACLATKSMKAMAGDKLSGCISDVNSERLEDGGKKKGSKCKGGCFVRGCGTGYMFQTRESLAPDGAGRRQVWLLLVIYRWLGGLKPPTEDASVESGTVMGGASQNMTDGGANPDADGEGPSELATVSEDASEANKTFVDAPEEPEHEVRQALKSPKIGEKEALWIGHTVDAAERTDMRARWEEWMKGAGGGGRCLPDWSICLLSSEDEGLKRATANAGLEGLAGILSERMG
ncbi:MAG: hypothetical protein Q9227_009489 [Pyrenula ochraceoflavens]